MKNQKVLDNIQEFADNTGRNILILTSLENCTKLLCEYWSNSPLIYNANSCFTMDYASGGSLSVCTWYNFNTKLIANPDILYAQYGSICEYFLSKWVKTPSIIRIDMMSNLVSMRGPA